jgi:hypothetical protein
MSGSHYDGIILLCNHTSLAPRALTHEKQPQWRGRWGSRGWGEDSFMIAGSFGSYTTISARDHGAGAG